MQMGCSEQRVYFCSAFLLIHWHSQERLGNGLKCVGRIRWILGISGELKAGSFLGVLAALTFLAREQRTVGGNQSSLPGQGSPLSTDDHRRKESLCELEGKPLCHQDI